MLPEALDAACGRSDIRAVFVQPSVINPTATLMSEARRQAIVAVARKHDLAIIENDVLGPLIEDRPPPVAALAPERTLYVTSFTKTADARTAHRLPRGAGPLRRAVANRHLVSNWMATPMVAEIAPKWVADGTAHRTGGLAAQGAAQRATASPPRCSGASPIMAHRESLHVWLPLAGNRSEESFVAQARLQGVAIAPGSSFGRRMRRATRAVRISLGSTTEEELRTGLSVVAQLALGDPEHLLLAI